MRALVLSGGGGKGSYQVGVLQHLLGDLHIHYDILSGTSVGAINASFLAQYPAGCESRAYADLRKLWDELDTPKVYRPWYHGLFWLLPAAWRRSVYSTQPLRDMIWAHLSPSRVKESGRKLRVSAVSMNTLERRVWTERAQKLHEAVEASAAMPAFFEPVDLEGHTWVDGGIREGTPLKDAIDAGATSIDVITLDWEGAESPFSKKPTTMDFVGRSIDAMLHEVTLWDIRYAELVNKMVDAGMAPGKRHLDIRVIRPSVSMGDARDFSPKHNREGFELGYRDAKAARW